jgi:hypothetical protein
MATHFAFGKIVTNGLVLALDAGDRNSYPGSGTTWTDLSENRNNGTLTNGPTFSSTNGGSIVFDGVDDIVNTSLDLGTNPIPSHTISVWFKTNSASGKKIIGIENVQSGQGTSLFDRHLYVGTDSKLYYAVYDVSSHFISSSANVTNNVWKNATAICTGANSISLYVDGILNGSTTGNSYSGYSNSYIRIGGYRLEAPTHPNSLPGYFTGNISVIQIYNRALSASEILQNYNAQKSRFNL